MNQPIKVHVVSRRLSRWKPSTHVTTIRDAGDDANSLLGEILTNLAPGLKVNVNGPTMTRGSVTFTIIVTSLDEEGRIGFTPHEAVIVCGHQVKKCQVVGPEQLGPNGTQVPVLISGMDRTMLANTHDLHPIDQFESLQAQAQRT